MKKDIYSYGSNSTISVFLISLIGLIKKSPVTIFQHTNHFVKRGLVLAVCMILLLQSKAQFPLYESFKNTTAPGFVIGGNTPAYLTAGSLDSAGSGFLRLTNASTYQLGYAYYNAVSIPSTYGMDVSFEYYMYGANTCDGMTFFLFDASTTTFNAGYPGGSLGYSNGCTINGLSNGYLGVGIDSHGEFSNPADNCKDGGPGQIQNAITLRGPGNGMSTTDYPYIASGQSPVTLRNGNGRVTDSTKAGFRKVRIVLLPNTGTITGYHVTVYLTSTIVNGPMPAPQKILEADATAIPPKFLKFGFTGATGGSFDFHEIRNLRVNVDSSTVYYNPTATPINGGNVCTGSSKTVSGTANATSNNVLGNIDPSTVDLDPATTGIQRTFTLSGKGTFTVDSASGLVTFVPLNTYSGIATINYTVNDTYRKISNISTISFTVLSPSSSTTSASICSGSTYLFNGTNYSTAGTFVVHLTNAVGCDSAASLILTVNAIPVLSSNPNPSARGYCIGATGTNLTVNMTSAGVGTINQYLWYSNTANTNIGGTLVATDNSSLLSDSYTPSTATTGVLYYYCIVSNSLGCTRTTGASGAFTISTIPVVSNIYGTSSLCSGSSTTLTDSTSGGTWSSNAISIATVNSNGLVTALSSGWITVSYVVSNQGCSTTKNFTFNVKASSASTTNVSICPSALPYTWNGLTFNAAGTQTVHFTNTKGCDSAATLNLIVNATTSSTLNASICTGSSYIFNGTSYNTAGTYTTHLTNVNGCDSVATLVLTVKANSASTTTATICSGSSYTFNGTSYNTAGTYIAHLTNAAGCDSAATLVLTVKANSASITTVGICSGSSYTFNGTSYNTAGTYIAHLTNAAGCDSAASLVLTVKANSTSTTTASICTGSSYIFNGTSYNTAGTYIAHLTNAAGCDSAATLVLTVKANSASTTTANICTGSSYIFNGTSYNTAGTYTAHLTNAAGCDSAATLVLTVKANSISTTSASICTGSSYIFNGISYNTAGTYIAHLTNAAGCDSAATLVLTVKANSTSTTTASICSGSSYTFNGISYNTAGTYTVHLTNTAGCDSAATLNLTVNQPSTSFTNITVCNSYLWNGTTYTTSGTYTYSTTNAVGCDSIATLNLIINKGTSSATNVSICNGKSYNFNGQTYSTAGTYLAFLTNAAGCDSVATLNLAVNQPSSSATNITACSSYLWNGTTYTTSGTYTYSTTNALGCDSIATLNLIINKGTSSATNISICNGTSYTFNGQTYSTAGTYLVFLTNAAGCDSIATLNLTVNQSTTSAINITACSSYTWNGTTLLTSGTYTYSTTNALGCDSTATLNLIINKGTTSAINVSICNGSSYTFNGQTYTTPGTYTANLINATGCDSIATLNLTFSSSSQSTLQEISGTSVVCPGDSTTLTNTTSGGIWTVDSTDIATIDSITGLVKGLTDGSATVTYTVGSAGSGCTASISVPFTVNCSSVGSGSTGGLESKSMGDAVAKRVYNAALSDKNNVVDYKKLPPVSTKSLIQVMGTATPGSLSLTDIMPVKESIGCGYTTYDMSSDLTDLPGMTNAAEVKTYDYVANSETKSVTFITRTYGNVYEHTKPICDRLKEAKLLDVQQITVQQMHFIQYKLQQNDGKIEYAISFSAGISKNDTKFSIQSVWLTKNFANLDTMYNFQVWAVEPDMAKYMLNNILQKLTNVMPLTQINDSLGIPKTYIRDITRNENSLIMDIVNRLN